MMTSFLSLAAVRRDANAPSPHEGRAALHWQVGESPSADWAVREGQWKLIGRSRDTSSQDGKSPRLANFLVNIQTDPGEQTNLAEKHPDILKRLRRLHEEHLR